MKLTPHQRATLLRKFPVLRQPVFTLDQDLAHRIAITMVTALAEKPLRLNVHVRGGVAYAYSSAIRIIDHDNH